MVSVISGEESAVFDVIAGGGVRLALVAVLVFIIDFFIVG